MELNDLLNMAKAKWDEAGVTPASNGAAPDGMIYWVPDKAFAVHPQIAEVLHVREEGITENERTRRWLRAALATMAEKQ